MKTSAREVNYDGLVGSTHNYAGLAIGNLASEQHAQLTSNPRAAVLEGLEKMRFMHQLGCLQAIIPPQSRPNTRWLSQLGYSGTREQIIQKAFKDDPRLVAIAYSAACMWTANAATVSPSADTRDGKIHITPANLMSQPHRFHESAYTAAILKQLFPDPRYFTHHASLPSNWLTSDEGAANHTRLCHQYGERGVEIFVYGKTGYADSATSKKYPARQSLEASRAIARLHGCDPESTLFLQQNPIAIDAGVFHNDVIAVGNQRQYFSHELAYLNKAPLLRLLDQKEMDYIEVSAKTISLDDAVKSYLFNSQLITDPEGNTHLIAPSECEELPSVRTYLKEQNFAKVHYVHCRQSMQNGGGPACLRLRVVMTIEEYQSAHPGVMFTEKLYVELKSWAEKHYRTELKPSDLLDPQLIQENERSLSALYQILNLKLDTVIR